jgi:coproporphyrinogen III oxidase
MRRLDLSPPSPLSLHIPPLSHDIRRCDEYFYLPNRAEHRGVGGIFFDDLSSLEGGASQALAFTREVAEAFMPSYLPSESPASRTYRACV